NGTGAAGHAAAGSTTTASSSETAPAPARGGPAPTGKGSVSGGAKATTPSKAAAPAPAALHMLLRVPLAFRVLNRDFSARLLDAASPEYGELSRSVLAVTTCSCRRKSRGKLFSAKDSYEPAAEYPPYQSHGRYAAPAGKHSPYSQVAGGAGAGTFTYTNPAAPEQP
uniref:Uncharacterized protein n=1 Tax=Nothoprocta perdicaria TaxID=30464 RepID=A0A8C6YY42_NOTPE